jgi:hypothetical protein
VIDRECRTLGTVALFLLATLPATLRAEASGVTGGVSLGLLNRYIFRGYQIGQPRGVAQPAISVAWKGFSISLWGNIDFNEQPTPSFVPDRPGRVSLDETDLTLSYTRSLGDLSGTVGFICYRTKYTAETEELFIGISYGGWGHPSLTVYRDIDSYPGWYISLTAAQSFPLGGRMTLDIGASAAGFIGTGDYWKTLVSETMLYTGDKYGALHDGMVKAGTTILLGKGFSLQPMIQICFPLSSGASRILDGLPYNPNGPVRTSVVFGVNGAFTF